MTKRKRYAIYLDVEIHEKATKRAEEERLSLSRFLEKLLEDHLEHQLVGVES